MMPPRCTADPPCAPALTGAGRAAPSRPAAVASLTRAAAVLAALLALAVPAAAAPAPATAPATAGRAVPLASVEGVQAHALPNGLRVLLFPDVSQSKLHVQVAYRVGARHEGYGERGMAHLLEHMLFKGSPRYPHFDAEMERHGGEANAETDQDYTTYYETLLGTPDNLRFALDLEADRMTRARLVTADLQTEFSVVRNELEQIENNPAEILRQRMFGCAFHFHNYGRDTIGTRSDIELVTIDHLQRFYARYYQPDNATVIVVGGFDPQAALRLIDQTFGRLPRPRRTLAPTYTIEPQQDGERAVVLRRTGEVATVAALYRAVPAVHADFAPLQALVALLTEEATGRLYKTLVEGGLAVRVDGFIEPRAEPGALFVQADLRRDQTPAQLRDRLTTLIEGLGTPAQPAITAAELRRYQIKARTAFDRTFSDPYALAMALTTWEAMGDFRLWFLQRDRIAALTPDSVQAAARRYLLPDNRTTGIFYPTPSPQRSPLPEPVAPSKLVASYRGEPPVPGGETFAPTLSNIRQRVRAHALPSGMKVALLPKRTRGGVVQILLSVRAGSLQTLRGLVPAARLLPRLLRRGTRQRSFQQLSDDLDRLRATLSIAGPDDGRDPHGGGTLYLETDRAHAAEALALLAEIVKEPALARDQFELVKKETLADLEEAQHDPGTLAATALLRSVDPYPPDDPRYTPTVPESIERTRALRLEDVARVHGTLWGGDAATLALVGDFDAQALDAAVTRHFGAWRAPRPYQRLPRPYQARPGAAERLRTPDKQNAVVALMALVQAADTAPDAPALTLWNYMLGSGPNSRLNRRVREREGLSYTVSSSLVLSAFEPSGAFTASATCAPQSADKALRALREEIESSLTQAPPAEELQRAKDNIAQSFATQLGSDAAVAALLVQVLERGRGLDHYERLLAGIAALTPADLAKAARRYIAPSRFVSTVAGDLK